LAERVAEALAGGGRLIYVGAGTSGRLGLLDAAECPPTFGTEPWQVQAIIAGGTPAILKAVEDAEDDAKAGARAVLALKPTATDVVCGISASAQTRFVIGALAAARKAGSHTVLICCNPKARRSLADQLLVANTGAELVAGSTRLKAGTATKLILNSISTAAMVRLGRVVAGQMVQLQPLNRKLRKRAARIRRGLK
jgi:N-acetylmuramic acid 6-phosphate etherase